MIDEISAEAVDASDVTAVPFLARLGTFVKDDKLIAAFKLLNLFLKNAVLVVMCSSNKVSKSLLLPST